MRRRTSPITTEKHRIAARCHRQIGGVAEMKSEGIADIPPRRSQVVVGVGAL